jgi:hypothetical protein
MLLSTRGSSLLWRKGRRNLSEGIRHDGHARRKYLKRKKRRDE